MAALRIAGRVGMAETVRVVGVVGMVGLVSAWCLGWFRVSLRLLEGWLRVGLGWFQGWCWFWVVLVFVQGLELALRV